MGRNFLVVVIAGDCAMTWAFHMLQKICCINISFQFIFTFGRNKTLSLEYLGPVAVFSIKILIYWSSTGWWWWVVVVVVGGGGFWVGGGCGGWGCRGGGWGWGLASMWWGSTQLQCIYYLVLYTDLWAAKGISAFQTSPLCIMWFYW